MKQCLLQNQRGIHTQREALQDSDESLIESLSVTLPATAVTFKS